MSSGREHSTAYDEAFSAPGVPRVHYEPILDRLAEVDLAACRDRLASDLRGRGVSYGGGELVVDLVPRLLTRDEWDPVAAGLEQRVRALGAFVEDAYGARRIVEAGRLPAQVIDGAEYFEPDMVGVPVPEGAWLSVAGLDLLRHPDGSFGVLEDNLRAPTGLTYAGLARAAVDEHVGYAAPAGRKPVEESAYELLGAALRAAAPDGRADPSVVILADGPENAAWIEQTEMGARLGVPVVGLADLSQRGRRLHARVDGAQRPVDVLYRRTDEDRLRDERGEPTPLAELLLPACRAGELACVNAFGAGVADDKLIHVYVEELVRFYLGEEPLLPSVRSYDLGVPEVRRQALERLGEIVVKPRSESGGAGIVIGPRAEPDELDRVRAAIERDPTGWIAQETVELSHHPTLRDGALVPRHVDLRPLIFTSGASVDALTGGLTRVALEEGDMVTNMASNRAVKDTWVIQTA